MSDRTKIAALLAGGAAVTTIVATLAATLLGGTGDAFTDCRGGQVAGGDIGGPFTLVDAQGRTVTDRDVITTPTILYFGYTFCPDVCPLDAARNADAVALLEERGIIATPVFVSIDPARDTPDVMAAYASAFHDRMIGLTGSDEQVAGASRAYRTSYGKQEGDPDFYLMNHSTFSYLVLPDVGFVDFVSREEPAEAVADRLECFVEAAA